MATAMPRPRRHRSIDDNLRVVRAAWRGWHDRQISQEAHLRSTATWLSGLARNFPSPARRKVTLVEPSEPRKVTSLAIKQPTLRASGACGAPTATKMPLRRRRGSKAASEALSSPSTVAIARSTGGIASASIDAITRSSTAATALRATSRRPIAKTRTRPQGKRGNDGAGFKKPTGAIDGDGRAWSYIGLSQPGIGCRASQPRRQSTAGAMSMPSAIGNRQPTGRHTFWA